MRQLFFYISVFVLIFLLYSNDSYSASSSEELSQKCKFLIDFKRQSPDQFLGFYKGVTKSEKKGIDRCLLLHFIETIAKKEAPFAFPTFNSGASSLNISPYADYYVSVAQNLKFNPDIEFANLLAKEAVFCGSSSAILLYLGIAETVPFVSIFAKGFGFASTTESIENASKAPLRTLLSSFIGAGSVCSPLLLKRIIKSVAFEEEDSIHALMACYSASYSWLMETMGPGSACFKARIKRSIISYLTHKCNYAVWNKCKSAH